MALQTCFPLSIELWIWKVEPEVIEFTFKSINVFWGGKKLDKSCINKRSQEYLDLFKFNQPFWLSLETLCVCGKLLYYGSIYEKDKKKNWVLREQNLIDFELSPDNFQLAISRYYGNELGKLPYLQGCSITLPFDTRSSLASFRQQLSIWSITSEITVGSFFDFYLFSLDITSVNQITCSSFSCVGRQPGWYFRLVLLDGQGDISTISGTPNNNNDPTPIY